jgi:hypothetical protein
MSFKINAAALLALEILGMNLAQASLIAEGPGLVYDNVANVTWSSDANLFATMYATDPNLVNQIIAAVPTIHDTPNSLDNAGPGNYNLSTADFSSVGFIDWWGAMAWVKYLDGINYLGQSTWELPTTYTQTCNYYNCTNSMLGELFYTGLGGTNFDPITTTHNSSYYLFTNVMNSSYWSATEYEYGLNGAWNFNTPTGVQSSDYKNFLFNFSWPVLPGKASANVPEPGVVALLGIGMLGLIAGLRLPWRHRSGGIPPRLP